MVDASSPAASSAASQVADRFGLGRVEPRQWGYRSSDVDALLGPLLGAPGNADGAAPVDDERLPDPSQLRSTVFRRERGGYRPADVDAAIDRLEDRAAAVEARRRVHAEGAQSWDEDVDAQLELILGRLERPAGWRFRAPSADSTRGYSTADVDALCEHVLARLHRQEAPEPQEIRSAVFGPAYGHGVYEEHQVDAFLDAVVDLLLALD